MERKSGPSIGKFSSKAAIYYAIKECTLCISLVWNGLVLFQNVKIGWKEWNTYCLISFKIEKNFQEQGYGDDYKDILKESIDKVNAIIHKISEHNELGKEIAVNGVKYSILISDLNDLIINTMILIYFGEIENNEQCGFLIRCGNTIYGENESNFSSEMGNMGNNTRTFLEGIDRIQNNPFVCFTCGKRSGTIMSTCTCGLITYCTRECQSQDWKRHKGLCPESKKNKAKAVSVNATKVSLEAGASSETAASLELSPKHCSNANCIKSGTFQCTICKCTKYCSRECQKADWKKHKKMCIKY